MEKKIIKLCFGRADTMGDYLKVINERDQTVVEYQLTFVVNWMEHDEFIANMLGDLFNNRFLNGPNLSEGEVVAICIAILKHFDTLDVEQIYHNLPKLENELTL